MADVVLYTRSLSSNVSTVLFADEESVKEAQSPPPVSAQSTDHTRDTSPPERLRPNDLGRTLSNDLFNYLLGC